MENLTAKLNKFCTDIMKAKKGVVAIIVAMSLIPLVLAVGVSIDISRGFLAKQRLQQATDAAGLAIAAGIDADSTEEELQDILDIFLPANITDQLVGSITSSGYTYIDTTVTVTAALTIDTIFMKLANINTMDVNAFSEVIRQEDTLEVVLVLDNSGSMGNDGKLTALKEASNSLVDILFGTATVSSQVKIGLVPFSNNVNIGSSNTAYITDPTAYDWGTSSWEGCVMAQTTNDEDTKDDVTDSWPPMFWADDNTYNNWKRNNGSSRINSSRGPNLYCIDAPITPMTNEKATLTDAIDNMVDNGGTHINLGAVWGWRTISPTEPFAEGVSYGVADNTKAVIILTDGANTAYDSLYDAFGYPSDRLLGASINTVSEVEEELDDRLETICTNIKDEGVIVYTITFSLSDISTQDIFKDCATDINKYYDSPTTTELTRTFRAIAAELKQLHVVN